MLSRRKLKSCIALQKILPTIYLLELWSSSKSFVLNFISSFWPIFRILNSSFLTLSLISQLLAAFLCNHDSICCFIGEGSSRHSTQNHNQFFCFLTWERIILFWANIFFAKNILKKKKNAHIAQVSDCDVDGELLQMYIGCRCWIHLCGMRPWFFYSTGRVAKMVLSYWYMI